MTARTFLNFLNLNNFQMSASCTESGLQNILIRFLYLHYKICGAAHGSVKN